MRKKLILIMLFLLTCALNVKAENIYYNLDELVNSSEIKENIKYIEISTTDNLYKLSDYINTKEILIKDTSIKDSSIFNNLNKLENITIYYSKINLEGFNNTSVKKIKILSSFIENDNLKPLSNAINLETLNLNGTYIKDLTSLKYLKTIKELSLNSISNIKDLTSVLNLVNLKTFDFAGSENLITKEILDFIKEKNIIGTLYSEKEYMYLKGYQYDEDLNNIINSLNLDNLSINDKIKKITLFVVDHMEYDDNCITSGCTNKEIEFNTVLTSLSYKGVCYHYALLETKLLNKAGIDAYLVSGMTTKGLGHAWVDVYIDGNWYAIDPTWIDTTYKNEELRKNGTTSYYMVNLKDTNQSTIYYKEHIPDVKVETLVDPNSKYAQEKDDIDKNLDVYDTIYIVFIALIVIFAIYIIINIIIKKNKKKRTKIKTKRKINR